MISWFSCYTKCALSFIFLLDSLKSLITSFLLYLSRMGQKLRFLFNSLYWYFVNENFDRLITFPKGSTRYRFVLSIVFRKRLMSPLFDEEILEFGLLKFFLGFCCWQRLRVRFLFPGGYWGCFATLVIIMVVGLVTGVAWIKYFQFLHDLFFAWEVKALFWVVELSAHGFVVFCLCVLINWWRSFPPYLVVSFFWPPSTGHFEFFALMIRFEKLFCWNFVLDFFCLSFELYLRTQVRSSQKTFQVLGFALV